MLCLASLLSALLFAISAAAQPYRPELRIAESNGNVTLSWPRVAYYYALVAKTNLTDQESWAGIATGASDFGTTIPFLSGLQAATNFTGNEIAFTVAATNEQAFYGLAGLRFIPICQFAVFYEGLLEFSTTATMAWNGPVHANSDIYTGTGASLTFNRTVTTTGTISSPARNGQGPWAYPGASFNSNPVFVTNVARLEVMSAHGPTNLHGLIEIPPGGENPASSPGWSRLYNQAQIVVVVSNTSVMLKIQAAGVGHNPGSDPSPIISYRANLAALLATNLPWLRATNSFTDQRESKLVNATQIDLGLYKDWLSSNASVLAKFPVGSGSYPTVLYVADTRTTTSSTMTAIRITNGIALPSNGGLGFTLATPNPLYVWGNYNCTNAAYLGTTNTSATVASALICDALTILSSAWKDSTSLGSLSSRTAASVDTVNAAIIAGNVPSTGSSSSAFSGGIHNFPRLLENWSSSSLWLNTSFVCLYPSTVATSVFQKPGVYYIPPSRNYNFDQNFTDMTKIPPGCPVVGVPVPGN